MSLHPRRRGRAMRIRVTTALWLTFVWALLWGDFRPGTLLAGLALGVLVVTVLPMPPLDFHGRVHPGPLAHLVHRFVVDLVAASVQVSWAALAPRKRTRGAIVRVRLRGRSDLYLTLTAVLTSLVPGSVIVEAHRMTGTLYVHVLDVGLSRGVEGARQAVLDTEARILRALASDAELAAAGLTRSVRADRRTGAERAGTARGTAGTGGAS